MSGTTWQGLLVGELLVGELLVGELLVGELLPRRLVVKSCFFDSVTQLSISRPLWPLSSTATLPR